MDIKVKAGNVEAVIVVSGVDEAIELLRKLAGENGVSQPHAEQLNRQASSLAADHISGSNSDASIDDGDGERAVTADEGSIRRAMMRMKGNPSAAVIDVLIKYPNGCKDDKLREEMGWKKDENLGPIFSHVSKCCKRFGVPREAVLLRHRKRLAGGVIVYHYKVTDAAARIARSIPEFGQIKEFPDFGDDAMT